MNDWARWRRALPGLGLASVVLGAVGLMLFVLPILSIPISGGGLIAGAAGVIAAAAGKAMDLRLSIAGMAICGAALAIAWAIDLAPGGYFRFPAEPPPSLPQRRRIYVPPPAPFEAIGSECALFRAFATDQ